MGKHLCKETNLLSVIWEEFITYVYQLWTQYTKLALQVGLGLGLD